MEYWWANRVRLGDCEEPLFDWIDKNKDVMERQCREIFGIDNSVYIPQYTDVFMTPTCSHQYADFQVLWSGAAAWIARHFYERWKFTDDRDFAYKRAYPYMKRCARFYLAFLRKHEDGRYHIVPSYNPENWTREGDEAVDTAVMDISIIRDLMRNLIELHDALDMGEDPERTRWQEIERNLPDYPIGKNGILFEWLDEREPLDPYHRHTAHLYGLHPGGEFADHAVYASAARKALEKRLENGTAALAGWSMVWASCFWARLYEGDKALQYLNFMIKGALLPNLLTTHNDWRKKPGYLSWFDKPLIQIEALFGAASGLCEMLMQEREDEILLLPALPDYLSAVGSVKGFSARHQVMVDFAWKDGIITQVTLASPKSCRVRIRKSPRFSPPNVPGFLSQDGKNIEVALQSSVPVIITNSPGISSKL
jgi:alpha-L-fucosidase 2